MDAVRAIRRLKTAFAFVGITEFWSESICLFHRQLGGDSGELELGNVRPGVHAMNETSRCRLDVKNQQVKPAEDGRLGVHESAALDPFDTVVYQAALRLFLERCQHFQVKLPSEALLRVVTPEAVCRAHPEHQVLCSKDVWEAIESVWTPPKKKNSRD